ncbi:hypothetical protein, partial [Paraburkholderia sediminicola]|uniref:hypothetical protein n=1 Tax=Paraburkholderia sediminicola TaxID=458836 RepID=UPI0038B808CA
MSGLRARPGDLFRLEDIRSTLRRREAIDYSEALSEIRPRRQTRAEFDPEPSFNFRESRRSRKTVFGPSTDCRMPGKSALREFAERPEFADQMKVP